MRTTTTTHTTAMEQPLAPHAQEKLLLTVAAAARLAGVSRSVAYRWAEAGTLPGAVRMRGRWYVWRRALEAWLDGLDRVNGAAR
ncbi:MAG: helix-turn-helix domain-containing protein [Chloroflexota bacterium]